MIVGLYGVSLCLLMPSVLSIGGFGELGVKICGRITKLEAIKMHSKNGTGTVCLIGVLIAQRSMTLNPKLK